jgi:hypothetical protein
VALIGAGLARLTGAERAQAGHVGPIPGTTFDGADSLAVHLGALNTRNTTNTVTTIKGSVVNAPQFVVNNGINSDFLPSFGDGIQAICGQAGGSGVLGYHSNGFGVFGVSSGSGANQSGVHGAAAAGVTNGVWGENASSATNATGVLGQATATSGTTVGVWGQSKSPAAGAVGMLGEVTATNAAGIGVKGVSPNGPGVYGTSTTAFGVQGLSQNAYGVSGNSTTQAGVWGSSNNNVGVLGSSTSGVGVNGISVSSNGVNGLSTSGIGVYGSSSGGLAGRFDGNVVIQGNLTVSGSFPHSAAVPSSDGTLRRLYSFEGTEAYYEDLGQGSLTNGIGVVSLDPAFTALVRADSYQVFLTAYGENRGLYVSNQTPSGFEVHEVQGGTSAIGFGYRVVARPRDLPTSRLDRVTLPPAPAQPQLDRVEPLDVPARLRDLRHPDRPSTGEQSAQPIRVQDTR